MTVFGMDGSMLPIAIAHGESRAEFATDDAAAAFTKSGLVSARYIEGNRRWPLTTAPTPTVHRSASLPSPTKVVV
jgi:phosphoribosylformylglycinamidine (FGAM) synthase-like amidotransferase family enzyme